MKNIYIDINFRFNTIQTIKNYIEGSQKKKVNDSIKHLTALDAQLGMLSGFEYKKRMLFIVALKPTPSPVAPGLGEVVSSSSAFIIWMQSLGRVSWKDMKLALLASGAKV